MAYCIEAQVQVEAGGARALDQLTDQGGSGNRDTAVLDQAIADADALINSYVAKQRAVPLSPVPDVIRKSSQEIAVYLLRAQKRMVTELEQATHDSRMRWLEQVAKGYVTLGVDPQPAKSALVSPAVVLCDDAETELTAENTKGAW